VQTVALSTLIFILPLIVLPFGVSFFEAPKVLIAQFLIQILAVSVLFQKRLFRQLDLNLLKLVLGLIILSIISLIFEGSSQLIFGNVFRMQGVLLLWHLGLLSIIGSRIDFKPNLYLVLISLAAISVSSFLFGEVNNRAVGSLGSANALAAVAVFFFPFLFLTKNSYLKLIALILTGVVIILTGSRSGVIAFVVELIFLLLFFCLNLNLKRSLLITLLLILTSLLLPFFEEKIVFNRVYKFESRAQVWDVSFHAGLSKPILGWGFGNVQTALRETAKKMNKDIQYVNVDSAHNLFLDFWIQGGILGVGLLVGFLGFGVIGLMRGEQVVLLVSLLGVLTSMLFNPASIVSLVHFWFLIGQGFKRVE